MPKVVSRGITSSSDQAGLTASARAVLRSYYCLCGDFVLVMQGKIDRLPQRKLDGSYIIRSQPSKDGKVAARKFKANLQAGSKCLVKRRGTQTLEVRQNLVCGRCNVVVGYQINSPPAGEAPFVYIHKGGITEIQGRIPPDAFDGEDEFDPLEDPIALHTEEGLSEPAVAPIS